jgi:hypothetical protein
MKRSSPQAGIRNASPDGVAEGVRLLQQGEHRRAIECFEACLGTRPVPADALHYRGLALFQLGDKEAGLASVRESIALAPTRLQYRQNLGGILLEEKRFDEARAEFDAIAAQRPDDYLALGSLCQALYRLGRHQEAVVAGQRCLEAKDRAFSGSATSPMNPVVPAFDPRARERNVIAYSLWGQDSFYLEGMLANAEAAPHLYPEWHVRVYCDESVPASVVADLARRQVQVVRMPGDRNGNFGLFWRFLVADDPGVDRFLCRDADSPLTLKERGAVDEWVDSGRPFHLMRDNALHCELVLAGLWGGVRGWLPPLAEPARQFYAGFRGRWSDQIFLRERLWPVIGPNALAHDSHYRLRETRPFPGFGRLPPGRHVGGAFPRGQDSRMPF